MDVDSLHSFSLLVLRLAAMWSTLPPPTQAPPPELHLSQATSRYRSIPQDLTFPSVSQPVVDLRHTVSIRRQTKDSKYFLRSSDEIGEKYAGERETPKSLNDQSILNGLRSDTDNDKVYSGDKQSQMTSKSDLDEDKMKYSRPKRSQMTINNQTMDDNITVVNNTLTRTVIGGMLSTPRKPPIGDTEETSLDYVEEVDMSINITAYESFYDSSALNTSFVISDNSSRNSTEVFILTNRVYEYQIIKVAVLCAVMSIVILSTCKMSLQVFAKFADNTKPSDI